MNRLLHYSARAISSIGANSINGGTVTLSDGLATYTPPTNSVGADLFTAVSPFGSVPLGGIWHRTCNEAKAQK